MFPSVENVGSLDDGVNHSDIDDELLDTTTNRLESKNHDPSPNTSLIEEKTSASAS